MVESGLAFALEGDAPRDAVGRDVALQQAGEGFVGHIVRLTRVAAGAVKAVEVAAGDDFELSPMGTEPMPL